MTARLRNALIAGLVRLRRAHWAIMRGQRLDALGLWHGADKSSAGGDFLGIYEGYLAPRRDDRITLYEIGVFRGASVRMWREYFPKARIVGIDIVEAAREHADDRIEVFIGDQADSGFLRSVAARAGAPDVVIDDGSHLVEHQLASLHTLWPLLKSGGLYVVEDTRTSYDANYLMGWRQAGATIEELKALVDDVNAPFHDQDTTLEQLEYIHFYRGTCVLKKLGPEARGSRFMRRLDGAAARSLGTWTSV